MVVDIMLLFYSPKESLLSIVGSPWLEWLSFPCFIGFSFFTPTNRGLYLVVGGWWGGGAYFLVEFWLFSKLFGSCFKIVWALFLDSEGPYLRVVSTQNIIWWPPKSRFLGEIYAIFSKLVPVIWPFWGPKKSFFGLFESWFGDVQKLFGHRFGP